MAPRLRLDQLEHLARSAGYEDYKSMLYDLYVVRRQSLQELQKRLTISATRLRRHLRTNGIPLRKQGGANNTKVVVTDQLMHEVAKFGIPIVARRLGITPSALRARVLARARER